jgi:hypothetical protein
VGICGKRWLTTRTKSKPSTPGMRMSEITRQTSLRSSR